MCDDHIETTMTQKRPLRIAVIEDDPAVWLLDREVLELHGYTVDVYSDDFHLLKNSEWWSDYDVALVDLMLPDVRGEDLLVYANQADPRPYLIVASAQVDWELREAKSLSDALIGKPYGVRELLATIEHGRR